jgi:chemotaxis response regulator CheB
MIRVLIAGMTRMLEGLIEEVILGDSELTVVGRIARGASLLDAIHVTQADVVVICGQYPDATSQCEAVLFDYPRLRVVVMDPTAQHGWHCALALMVKAIPEVSAASLVAAIHCEGREQAYRGPP